MLPHDEHNARLLDHVHPPTWVNPTPAARYNLVVIGAGTAGLVTAAGAAGLGAKVALIERDLMGGDCLNVGCVPSKALISAARAAASVRRAGEIGVSAKLETLELPRVMERVRRLRADIAPNDSAARFQSLGVDVFLGEGRFTGPDTIEVAGQTLRFKQAVIATGARASRPDTPGLAEAGYLTNETVFNLTELPPRLAVIGGGPIGCELAQAFARLGAEVTLIERSQQLLGREDEAAARLVQASLERDGVRVLLDAVVERVTSAITDQADARVKDEAARNSTTLDETTVVETPIDETSERGGVRPLALGRQPAVCQEAVGTEPVCKEPGGLRRPAQEDIALGSVGTTQKTLVVRQGGETSEVTVDEILVAAGRTPNVEGLNLEAVGIEYDRAKGVAVNDRLQTTNPRIFAAGDVCSPFKFTHAADFMARIVIQNALFFGRAKASALVIPWCTYTSPEVAHVGLTERAAAEQGMEVRAFVQDFRHVDRAILEGSTDGFVKILVKSGTDRIVGATIVADHAGEMIGEIVLAMKHRIGLGRLASVIHPYPTVAEAIRKCGDAYNKTRLTPFVKRLFERWLAWTR